MNKQQGNKVGTKTEIAACRRNTSAHFMFRVNIGEAQMIRILPVTDDGCLLKPLERIGGLMQHRYSWTCGSSNEISIDNNCLIS